MLFDGRLENSCIENEARIDFSSTMNVNSLTFIGKNQKTQVDIISFISNIKKELSD